MEHLPDHILVESARLLLRQPEPGDQPALERIFCNPEMMRYMGSVWDVEKVKEVIQEWHDIWGMDHIWCGVLVKKDTLAVIGTAGVSENTLTGEAGLELSWFVRPEYQRQGFATEITRALLRVVYVELDGRRVVAETHPQNPASNQVLARLHFTCLGERHHAYDDLPGFDTQMLWELTREAWQAAHQP